MDAACDCPHLDRNDPRCGGRFSLTHLEEAFSFCLGGFRRCPLFHRLNGEIARQATARPPRRALEGSAAPRWTAPAVSFTHVTCHGRPVVAAAGLGDAAP